MGFQPSALGLVDSEVDPGNLQQQRYFLTEKGQELYDKVMTRYREFENSVHQEIRACRKLWRRPQDGPWRSQFHALLTCGRPKQSASSWFCSRTVHAPAKPKPLRSHSIASNP